MQLAEKGYRVISVGPLLCVPSGLCVFWKPTANCIHSQTLPCETRQSEWSLGVNVVDMSNLSSQA